ncbi:MAG TPA: hypothetical protein VHP11_07745, partial [Tepidisphaeraceae bacterium]|nr:hypothetical protein [Tepidisphaeraceae bacterium]
TDFTSFTPKRYTASDFTVASLHLPTPTAVVDRIHGKDYVFSPADADEKYFGPLQPTPAPVAPK